MAIDSKTQDLIRHLRTPQADGGRGMSLGDVAQTLKLSKGTVQRYSPRQESQQHLPTETLERAKVMRRPKAEGGEGLSVPMIAKELGLNTTTLYRHLPAGGRPAPRELTTEEMQLLDKLDSEGMPLRDVFAATNLPQRLVSEYLARKGNTISAGDLDTMVRLAKEGRSWALIAKELKINAMTVARHLLAKGFRGKGTGLPEDVIAEIRRRTDAGESLTSVAKALEISRLTAWKYSAP